MFKFRGEKERSQFKRAAHGDTNEHSSHYAGEGRVAATRPCQEMGKAVGSSPVLERSTVKRLETANPVHFLKHVMAE